MRIAVVIPASPGIAAKLEVAVSWALYKENKKSDVYLVTLMVFYQRPNILMAKFLFAIIKIL